MVLEKTIIMSLLTSVNQNISFKEIAKLAVSSKLIVQHNEERKIISGLDFKRSIIFTDDGKSYGEVSGYSGYIKDLKPVLRTVSSLTEEHAAGVFEDVMEWKKCKDDPFVFTSGNQEIIFKNSGVMYFFPDVKKSNYFSTKCKATELTTLNYDVFNLIRDKKAIEM